MNILHRTKVITVSGHTKKEQVQDLLARYHIEYRIKGKDILQKNPADAARIGTLGMNQIKMQYSFYVDRADADAARELVRSV